ncbi:hypothetical protein TRFO_22634 [Tritrichomonas foetus]|uniref:Uncharacterized protein n=1 Tax=Tritrichomonas foetus TaxID=1144522 RepID=A0A1J4KCT6_9EUKA|nr:hypothetical protein TRFO_22634 [Tritrichomonas foetus]|eukprot:OHT08786.1 hypothetical protein TRFO_22634 [Tritrichomonas foetus]
MQRCGRNLSSKWAKSLSRVQWKSNIRAPSQPPSQIISMSNSQNISRVSSQAENLLMRQYFPKPTKSAQVEVKERKPVDTFNLIHRAFDSSYERRKNEIQQIIKREELKQKKIETLEQMKSLERRKISRNVNQLNDNRVIEQIYNNYRSKEIGKNTFGKQMRLPIEGIRNESQKRCFFWG